MTELQPHLGLTPVISKVSSSAFSPVFGHLFLIPLKLKEMILCLQFPAVFVDPFVSSDFAFQVLRSTFPQHTFLMNGLIHGVKVRARRTHLCDRVQVTHAAAQLHAWKQEDFIRARVHMAVIWGHLFFTLQVGHGSSSSYFSFWNDPSGTSETFFCVLMPHRGGRKSNRRAFSERSAPSSVSSSKNSRRVSAGLEALAWIGWFLSPSCQRSVHVGLHVSSPVTSTRAKKQQPPFLFQAVFSL